MLCYDGLDNGFTQFITKRHFKSTLIVTLTAVSSETIFLIQSITSLRSGGELGLGYLAMFPFILLVGWLYYLSQKYLASNLSIFAADNGFSYRHDGTVDLSPSSLSRAGSSYSVFDVVAGNLGSYPMQLFLCNVQVNSKVGLVVRSSAQATDTFYETVLEVSLPGHLPQLLLVNHQTGFDKLNIDKGFGTQNTISLEGDFDRYFKLYTEPGNSVEALEVFSPDTMQLMEADSKDFSIEFTSGHMYIYMSKSVKTAEQLRALFNLANHLMIKVAPLAMRMEQSETTAQ